MQWATEEPQKKRDRKSEDRSNLPLEVHIRGERQKLEKEKKNIPVLKSKVEEIMKKTEEMTSRFQIRKKNELIEECEELNKKIDSLENDEEMREFERRILPYTKAHMNRKNTHGNANKKMKRNIMLPGETQYVLEAFISHDNDTASNMISEYLSDIHNEAPKLIIDSKDTCRLCNGQMILIATKSIMACQTCGYATTYLDATTSSVSYGDEVEFASFSYKRLNHFNEWLQQVQAKESFEISQDVIDQVMNELHRQRVQYEDINQKKVREILKVIRLRKTYEHVAQITSRITGVPPPRMTPEMEEMCRLMFIAVQPAFEKHCPPDRKNFLSYSYCLYKFFQLLGYDDLLGSFTLLKGRDKLQKQDQIFQKICEELDWEFLASV